MTGVENINPYSGDSRGKKEQVAAMFDAIAPAYDFMNRAMSFGLDRLWLKALLREVRRSRPNRVVDLATGTGDVAFAIASALPDATVEGIDISEGMLAKARERASASPSGTRLTFRCADGTDTGIAPDSADAVTIAYGIRNFADIEGGYREMHRILRKGGTLAVLELSKPVNPLVRPFYAFYTRCLIPLAGRIVSGDSRAYSYLPESIAAAPAGEDMTAIMKRAGFAGATFRRLSFGVCTLYTATKE
ncbi:MAG: bifunctional demethylmenaquinone methyltransferase/2-methoxy-6-polyprenyl-1,4-benzoquinol methylase UbiE [Muribaculaceae bacterium]|nr:bifunctional demethylmenaquinone methyltransferase/2-methoxy-6-polyprenyl-1,4-benzoquinol methylase UbiE [Muribaculaceae bacterium]